jgi:uncharacterized membrane protein
LGVGVIFWILIVVILGFSLFIYPFIPAVVYPIAGEKGADCALLLLALITALIILMVLILSELAKVATVTIQGGVANACAISIECIRNGFWRCFGSAGCWIAATLVLLIVTSLGLTALDAGRSGRVTIFALAHQLTILALCFAHLSWWAFAREIIRTNPNLNSDCRSAQQ